ncbi:hypothetical protein [Cryobacterium sp. Hb1]|uniref:hypothetical protein n=1 Tax=Cryobacterium sp. Hb1 TaxID=1259147 RepID=UPI00106A933C|nr:hypothetical protein [Cryobacterium sp. Hb1]TFD72140.1 hypothetical protein E3T38_01195 [Cryobacterium sp. Hb1]
MTFDSFAEGTFLFPPEEYPDAAAYLQFWNTVPISDGVLANISAARAELLRKRSIATGVSWGQTYDAKNALELHHKNPRREAIADAARAVAYEAHMTEWWGDTPKEIDPSFARRVARTGQMYWYRTCLSEEDQLEVEKTTVYMGGKDLTLGRACGRYLLNEIRASFREPATTMAELLDDVRVEIQRLQV